MPRARNFWWEWGARARDSAGVGLLHHWQTTLNATPSPLHQWNRSQIANLGRQPWRIRRNLQVEAGALWGVLFSSPTPWSTTSLHQVGTHSREWWGWRLREKQCRGKRARVGRHGRIESSTSSVRRRQSNSRRRRRAPRGANETYWEGWSYERSWSCGVGRRNECTCEGRWG